MDIKSFREDWMKMKTQAEFADYLGVDEACVSRWEKDSETIGYLAFQDIAKKCKVSLDFLAGWQRPVPLTVNNTWERADFTKCTLSEYISRKLTEANIPDEQRKAYVDSLRDGIEKNLVKPKVAIVGRSDTGKSTLINKLIGSDQMPTSWTPTTSIAVYLKHISDKPSFLDENVWVFANHHGGENLWDERRLHDEAYCNSWIIDAGEIDILHSYGTRQGDNYDREAGSAVVFLDAPILKNCDIVDLPGFGTETKSDDKITSIVAQTADVVIYLSQANGFMRIEDINYLKQNISGLPVLEKQGENEIPPLANLFVVASQAHTVSSGNRAQIETILNVGCQNLLKTLPEEYWAGRQKLSGYTYEEKGYAELRARFFAYTIDIPDICVPFNSAFAEVLEALPIIINDRTKAYVREYVAYRKPNLLNEIQKYEGIVTERNKYVALLNEIDLKEDRRVQDNDKRKQGFRAEIQQFSDESVREFSTYLASTINTDAIIQLLKKRGIKNKKDEIELFGGSVQSMIQEKCEKILSQKNEVLAEKMKEYINAFNRSINFQKSKGGIEVDFDAGWAFTSALSTIGVLGGLGGFVYGIASAAVVLSGMGLSAGSTVLIGLLGASPIFAPISLVVGLALAGGLGIVKLFGGGWEKSVAKKIVASFEENGVGEKYRDGIRSYWMQTTEAFDQAAANLESEWNAYVNNLRDAVNEHDISAIQQKIAALNYLSDFFDNIPL